MHATNEAGWHNPNMINHRKHPANKSQTGWSMFVHVSKSHHSGGQSVFHVRPISLSTSQGLNMSMSLFVQLPQVRQYPPRHCAVVFPIPFSTVVQTLFAASSNIGLGCTQRPLDRSKPNHRMEQKWREQPRSKKCIVMVIRYLTRKIPAPTSQKILKIHCHLDAKMELVSGLGL